jgi:hypothetical protein
MRGCPLVAMYIGLKRGHAGKQLGDDMHRFLMRNHAPVLSVSTWVAVIGLTLLANAA